MTEQDGFVEKPLELFSNFGPDFLEDHARRIVRDPRIAIVELVANCWDAGADKVDIQWPIDPVPEEIRIEDNGIGMTHTQFINRWRQLNYNRRISQGEDVAFPPDNQASHRKAFGKNGKGRHSMFCFASEYNVETWRDGEANLYKITRVQTIARAPYQITHLKQFVREGHGTIVSASLSRNHIDVPTIHDLIGSKFVTDPTFVIFINGERIELTNLDHLLDIQEIQIPGIGTITISQVDTKKTSRTSRMHGIAWWVKKRLVGDITWQGFGGSGFLDGRTVEAKRYTFVVEADPLEDDVEDDWSEFKNTEGYQAVKREVHKHIEKRLAELMKDVHKAKKKTAMEANAEQLRALSPDSKFFIGQTIDGLQSRLPSIRQDVLDNTVAVLTNLEKSRSGYELLEQLAKLKPQELNELGNILANWTVQEARIVLSELEWRLKLIDRLESLVENKESDELHDIHPLFENGLWIFGPEYESVEFTSNRSLLTVLRDLLGDRSNINLSNPRKRPDLVVLPDSTLSVHAQDSFDQESNVDGFSKVLILELKRGGKSIGIEERRQGEDYATELRKSGKIQKSTKIDVYVLGSKVDEEINEPLKIGDAVRVFPKAYTVILRQAKARTFHLHKKIKDAKQGALFDPDIEEVLDFPVQRSIFAYKS